MVRFRYIADDTPDAPLILFFGSDREVIKRISSLIRRLSTKELSTVKASEIPGVTSADGTDVVLTLGEIDKGVFPLSEREFNWCLTEQGWDDIAELLQPFVEHERRNQSQTTAYHQFLEPQVRMPASAISVLITTSNEGRW